MVGGHETLGMGFVPLSPNSGAPPSSYPALGGAGLAAAPRQGPIFAQKRDENLQFLPRITEPGFHLRREKGGRKPVNTKHWGIGPKMLPVEEGKGSGRRGGDMSPSPHFGPAPRWGNRRFSTKKEVKTCKTTQQPGNQCAQIPWDLNSFCHRAPVLPRFIFHPHPPGPPSMEMLVCT